MLICLVSSFWSKSQENSPWYNLSLLLYCRQFLHWVICHCLEWFTKKSNLFKTTNNDYEHKVLCSHWPTAQTEFKEEILINISTTIKSQYNFLMYNSCPITQKLSHYLYINPTFFIQFLSRKYKFQHIFKKNNWSFMSSAR